jgi:hypothetical protein
VKPKKPDEDEGDESDSNGAIDRDWW